MPQNGLDMARKKKREISKMLNVRVKTEDGQVFDSKKEYARYLTLRKMEQEGQIWNLRRQVRYVLLPSQHMEVPVQLKRKVGTKKVCLFRETAYVADFVYVQDDEEVVEDVKSVYTRKEPVYKLKKKLMYMIHNIMIKEVN